MLKKKMGARVGVWEKAQNDPLSLNIDLKWSFLYYMEH